MQIQPQNAAERTLPSSIRVWTVAILSAIFILGGLELFWRVNGYQTTLQDDQMLWCQVRDRVANSSDNSLVVIGHSRIRQAFDNEEFHKIAPHTDVLQLAFFNSSPIASLRDLATNTDYSGVVICSMLSHCLIPEEWQDTTTSPYGSQVLDYYHQDWNISKKLNRVFATTSQSSLAMLHPKLAIQYAAPDILKSEWPIQWVWTDANRMQKVEYQKTDIDRLKIRRIDEIKEIMETCTRHEGYKNWPQSCVFERIESWVSEIQGRGGRVLFFRPITSGKYGKIIDDHFPRQRFWDVFAQSTSAETLHYLDHPLMSTLQCVEGSHLNVENTKPFTKALAQELIDRNLLHK